MPPPNIRHAILLIREVSTLTALASNRVYEEVTANMSRSIDGHASSEGSQVNALGVAVSGGTADDENIAEALDPTCSHRRYHRDPYSGLQREIWRPGVLVLSYEVTGS